MRMLIMTIKYCKPNVSIVMSTLFLTELHVYVDITFLYAANKLNTIFVEVMSRFIFAIKVKPNDP